MWALVLAAGLTLAWLASAGLQAQAKKASGSLSTLFAANNGNAGNTFDLEVLPRGGVVVKRFDLNLQGEGVTTPIQVWTRPGTAEGFENSSAGWTLRGTAEVTSEGEDNPTPLAVSFPLSQGSYGVAVGAPGDNPDLTVAYTANPEQTTFEDDALRLVVGAGLGSPILDGGGAVSNRLWNGTIYYRVPCEAAKKKLKQAKKQVRKAKRKLADAVASGDAQDIAVAEQRLDKKQQKQKKAKRKKKRACS